MPEQTKDQIEQIMIKKIAKTQKLIKQYRLEIKTTETKIALLRDTLKIYYEDLVDLCEDDMYEMDG